MHAYAGSRPMKFANLFLVCAMLLSLTLASRPQTNAAASPAIKPDAVEPLVVTNLNDSGNGSLRAAVAAAVDGDLIVFDPALTGEVALNSRIIIEKSIVIVGNGPDVLAISGQEAIQIFQIGSEEIPAVSVTIAGLHLTKAGPKFTGNGGAIQNFGTLRLTYCAISENKALENGGAIYNHTGSILVIDQCQIGYNQAVGTGGSTGNLGANGGAIWSDGVVEIRNSLIGANSATLYGGAIHLATNASATIENVELTSNVVSGLPANSLGAGGAISNYGGSLIVRNSEITNNQVYSRMLGGGAIYALADSQTTIEHTLIQGNQVGGSGGAIDNNGEMLIVDSTIDDNHAVGGFSDGGGIENNGPLQVIRTTISNNTTVNDGGGIDMVFHSVSLVNSTLSGNMAGRHGGAIFNSDQALSALHSTIVGNSASNQGYDVGKGGGFYYEDFDAEEEDPEPSGINQPNEEAELPSFIHLENTILALNEQVGDADHPAITSDCFTETGENVDVQVTLLATNWIGAVDPATCTLTYASGAQLLSGDPVLYPLANNGGPTRTYAPLINSPLVDAATGANCPAEDQRLAQRPVDGDGDGSPACDLGSFEGQPGPAGQDWAPLADSQHVLLLEDNNVEITLTGGDPEGGTLTYSIVAQPEHGSLVGEANVFTYHPDGDFYGEDSFDFQVQDPNGGKSVAAVTLEVISGAEDLAIFVMPSATEILAGQDLNYELYVGNQGSSIAFNVIVEDTLPDGLTFSAGSSAGCAASGQKITCVLGALAPGEMVTRTIKTRSSTTLNQLVINTAKVLATSDDPLLSNNVSSGYTYVAPGQIVYFNGFENGPGEGWSNPKVATSPYGANFLGEFGNQTVTLTIPNLGPHTHVEVSFYLYVIRSWDGNQTVNSFNPYETRLYGSGRPVGPDQWSFSLGKKELLRTTFTNWDLAEYTQAFPGALGYTNPALRGAFASNVLGYMVGPFPMDAVYYLTFSQPHTGNTLVLDFAALGLQELADESWGIDNVQVIITAGADLRPFKAYLPISVTR